MVIKLGGGFGSVDPDHHQNATCGVSPFMESGQHPPATYAYIRLRVLLPQLSIINF